MKGDIVKKILVEVSRVILGITFTFSGFVKAVDPSGTVYKIQDYLIAFGLDFFFFLSFPIAILLCVVEFSVGIFMLIGIYRKWNSRMALLIMTFMTPFTLYLAIANPVSDCGCFGDFLIISNWETFFKNIVLLAAAIVTFLYHEKIQNFYTGKFYWLIALFVFSFGILFSVANCYFEPVFDFRPYRIGANFPELMTVEEGKGDVYENIFIYEKEGVKKEFTADNYPWQDTAWIFVDRIDKLVKEGEKPAITDFSINRLYYDADTKSFEEEEDITLEVLEDERYTFLMIAYSLDEMRESAISKLEDVKNYADDNGYKFYCLTASTTDGIIEWQNENSVDFNFCLTDERTLKTMMRTNPGLMLLENGVIVNKWAPSEIPAEEDLTAPLQELPYSEIPDTEAADKRHMTFLIVVFVVPLLFIKIMDFLIYRKRKPRNKEEEKTNN